MIGTLSTYLWLALKFLGAMFVLGAAVVTVKRMRGSDGG